MPFLSRLCELRTPRCVVRYILNPVTERACACMCECVSLQKPDGVDMEVVEEVGVRGSSVRTLVLHQVALQGLLAGVALFNHPELRKKITAVMFPGNKNNEIFKARGS